MPQTIEITDEMCLAAMRAEWEAERALMIAKDEDDIGPFEEAEWPPEGEGWTREQSIEMTRASLLAALRADGREHR